MSSCVAFREDPPCGWGRHCSVGGGYRTNSATTSTPSNPNYPSSKAGVDLVLPASGSPLELADKVIDHLPGRERVFLVQGSGQGPTVPWTTR
jgi:hypothetical protein